MIAGLLCALFMICGPSVVDLPPPATPASLEAQVMVHSVPLVARWEGMPCDGDRCAAYLDTLAEPDLWTICAGETEGVRPGEVRTRAECEAGLRAGLIRYWRALLPYFEPGTLAMFLTPQRGAAFNSLSWNIGVAGTGRSTAMRRLNAGDIRGACEAIGMWNRAGGRVIRGLVNRRADETALCLVGVR